MRSVQTEVAHFPTVPLKQREKFRDCVSHLVVVFWSWLRRVSLLGNTREFPILNFRNMFHKWTKGCGCLPDKTIYGVIMNRNSWLRMMRCIKTSDFPPLWLQNVLTNTCLYFLLLLSKNIFIQQAIYKLLSPLQHIVFYARAALQKGFSIDKCYLDASQGLWPIRSRSATFLLPSSP